MKKILFSVLLSLSICASVNAQEQLDQSQLVSTGSASSSTSSWIAQTFQAGIGGKLTKVSIQLRDLSAGTPNRTLYILADSVNGAKLDSVTVTLPGTATMIDVLLPNGPELSAGQDYAIAVTNSGSGETSVSMSINNDYPAGAGYLAFGSYPTLFLSPVHFSGNGDLLFKTFVTVSCLDETKPFASNEAAICYGDSTSIDLPNSEPGIVYQLTDLAGSNIGGVQIGNGDTLQFPTGALIQDSSFLLVGNVFSTYGVDFAHVDTAIIAEGTTNMSPQNRDMTWNFWINITDTTSDQAIVSYAAPETQSQGYEINYFAATKSISYIWISGGVRDTVSLPITGNEWTQVSFTYIRNDGGRAYKNGVEVDYEPTANFMVGFTDDLIIGLDQRLSNNLNPFTGKIDEFSHFASVLSDSAILALNNDTSVITGGEPGILFYYSFNNNPGDSIASDEGVGGYDMRFSQTDYDSIWFVSPIFVPDPCSSQLEDTAWVQVGSQMSLAVDTIVQVQCYGDSTGAISVTTSGNWGPENYMWDNGVGAVEDPVNLPANLYQVTVTDSFGCSIQSGFLNVNQSDSISIAMSSMDVACYGDSTGSVTISASGGTGTLNYSWDNGIGSVQNPTGIPAGKYILTVTDSFSCQKIDSAMISQTDSIQIFTSWMDASCQGATNGFASVDSVWGGNGMFNYLWNGSDTTSMINGLGAGAYNLVVTDSAGCSDSVLVNVGEPATGPNVSINEGSSITGCDGVMTTLTVTPQTDIMYSWFIDGQPIIGGWDSVSLITGISNVNELLLTEENGKLYKGVRYWNGSAGVFRVYEWMGGSWSIVGGTDAVGTQTNNAVLISTGGMLYAAYTDGITTGVVEYNGATWQNTGSFSDVAGGSFTLSKGNGGKPILTLRDFNTNEVLVYEKSGSGWVGADTNSPSIGTAIGNGITTTSDGTNHYTVYRDNTLSNAWVVKVNDGTGWSYLGDTIVDSDATGEAYISYAGGELMVAYQHANERLAVKKYSGGTWVNVGPAEITSDIIYQPQLQYVNGNWFVSYEDDAASYDVQILRFDGANWVKHKYATTGFSGQSILSHDIEMYNGTLHLVYKTFSAPTGHFKSGVTVDGPSVSFIADSSFTYNVIAKDTLGCSDTASIDVNYHNVDAQISVSSPILTAMPVAAAYQWLKCDSSNLPIAGATNVSYTVVSNGTYTVEVTENGCIDTATCELLNVVGIDPDFNATISAYPNPFNEELVVTFADPFTGKISVSNTTGQQISEATTTGSLFEKISIVGSSGVYMVTVVSDKGQVATFKVRKN